MALNADNPRGPYRKASLAARLDLNSIPEPNSGCFLWTGYVGKDGYARLSVIIGGKQKSRLAHIVAFELVRGAVPAGLELDHKCRTRCCINPLHLEAVTHQVNVLRGASLPAQRAAQVACSVGHPFTDENTYVEPDGSRRCRTCASAYRHDYRERTGS